ncbi:carbohydrate binding domain-containing protein [Klebsiella aerogenes]|uniref:phage tail tip fiber protein n=1 Tax=Klebsiella aerogenes TaxID=548 RepID=UPI0035CF346A
MLPAPDFDPATGISTIAIPDIPWQASGTIRRLRLDFSQGGADDADNYYAVDWLAVGRPTPGASQAQIQDLKTAMTAADSAEAMERNQLAVQLRGNEEGTDPNKLVSGLLFEERKIRVTAEKAIGSRVDTLRVDYDKSTAAATQRMDTLASDLQSTASKTDQVAADLVSANGVIAGHTLAIQKIEGDVQTIDGKVQANASQIAGVESKVDNIRIGGVNLIPNSGELTGKSPSATERYRGNAVRILTRAAGATDFAVLDYTLAAPVDGTEYVLSFYAKAKTDKTPVRCFLNTPDATIRAETSQGVIVERPAGYNGDVTVTLSTSWRRYWVKYKRKPGLSGTAYLVVARLDGAAAAREAWISSPMFESGNIVSDWSQAPADSASSDAVQQLTTRVTTAENTLATTAQQTTALTSQITTGNLLLNGDLINKADNWQLSGTGAGAPVYDAVMKGLTTTEPAMRIANGTKIPVEAGQVLTLTFGFKTDDATISIGTQNFTMGLIENWGDPTNWLVLDNTWFAGITTGYQTRTLTFTIPNDFKGKRIDQKADSSTVQDLSATVTKQGQDITAANQAITSLKGRVSTVEEGLAKAATADAVSKLDTRVTNAEGKIESQGTAITGINVALNSQTAAGGDYILNPTFDPAYPSMGFTRRDTVDSNDDDGIPYDADIPAGAPRRYVARLASRDHQLNTPPWPVKAGQVFEISVWVAAKAGSNAAFNMYIGSATGPNTGAVAYAALPGSVAPTQTWTEKKYRWTVPANFPRGYMRPFLQVNQNAPFGSVWYATDFHCREITAAQGAQTAADAAADAVTQLDAKVTQQGNTITSQGQAITAITGRVSNLESGQSANSSAIQSLTQRTTAAEGKIETNSQAITSVTGAVNAMLNRGENLANDFNFMSGSALWGVQGNTRNKVEFGDFGDGKPGVQMTQLDSTLYTGLFANQKAPLPHNTPRRYQVIVKAKGVSGAMNFMVRRFNYQGNVAGTYENRQFSATDTWATYAAEFSAPSSATVDGSVFALYCYPNASVIQIDYIAIYDITDAVAIDANTSAVTQLQQTVTQQGKDIAANASATTAVSASLNAAMADVDNKITGNLILNGGFERDFTNWTAPAPTTIMAASSPHSGKKIVKYVAATSATLLSSDTVITVVKGRTYKFGAWLRAKAGSTMQPNTQPNNKVRFAYLDSSVIVEARFDPATMLTGSVWQEYSNTWTATKDGTMSVSINAFLNAGEIYIDDVYVIDITDRVDLGATAGAVSNLQSTVTQQGKDIASNASAITSVNASIGALQSQGLNPWCDGSFESYTANQQLGSSSLARVSTDVYRNGQKSLKITRNNGESGNSDKMIGNWLAVRGGGKYRFSLWAYMASDMSTPNGWSVSVGLFARGENGGANQWPEAVRISETNISRGKWVLLTGVATVGADRSIAQMWISTRGANGGAGYSLYLDDISIVDVTDAQEAQDTATGAANAVTQLTATVTQQGKDITAQAGQITSLGSRVDDAESRITKQDETIASNGLAMATGFNQMRSMIGDNSAAITTTNKTVADLEKSTTEQITTLTSQVGDMSATVQQMASTVADLNGKLGAQWGVKVNTSSGGNNYVAGIQLGIDGSGQSQFLVQADTFGVYVPNGDQKDMVFGIDGNGAYFQQAMARNLTINFGQISDSLQSTNYQPGSTGWRLPKNGAFEMNSNVPGQGRIQLDESGLKVFDQNGVLRFVGGRY